MSRVPVVHAITNDDVLLRDDFLDRARSVMTVLGPRGAVHLRASRVSARRLYELGLRLHGWERETACWAVVNDRIDVACAAGIGAVQLTTRSVPVREAAAAWPHLRIGASVHSPAAAVSAEQAGALWCVAGTAFPTASHPEAVPAGASGLAGISAAVSIPVIGIGGVTPDSAAQLLRVGIHGLAAISGIWHAADPGDAARHYLSAYDAHGGIG